MNEQNVRQLVDEIENANTREFWWDSELLGRVSQVKDVRMVWALALRHHGLSNKDAFSAHVVRNTIKTIDAPDFPLSWSIIDSEKDAGQLIQHLEDFCYAPWAAAFILGEIGGAGALRGVAARLSPDHSARHYMIVRITSHLLIRYLKIQAPKPVTMTVIDLKTGEMKKGVPAAENSPNYRMEMLRRSQADELFAPLERSLVEDIRAKLGRIPDQVLNCTRDQFNRALDQVPKR
jgi:hypothetical protein